MTSLIPTDIQADYFISKLNDDNSDEMNTLEAVTRLPQLFDPKTRYFATILYTFDSYKVNVTTYISNITLAVGGNDNIGTVDVASGFAIADDNSNIVASAHIDPMPVLVSGKTTTQDLLNITDQWAVEALINHIEQQVSAQATIDAFNQDDADLQDYLNDSTEFSTHSDV